MTAVKWSGNLTEHFSVDEYIVGNSKNATLTITRRSMGFARRFEKFRKRLGLAVIVTSWRRSEALNKQVGGIATSNHLTGTAADWHTTVPITEKLFIKWAKWWKKICKAGGYVGEAGLYFDQNGKPYFIHFGIQNENQLKANGGKFIHWKTIYVKNSSGKLVTKQINYPYSI